MVALPHSESALTVLVRRAEKSAAERDAALATAVAARDALEHVLQACSAKEWRPHDEQRAISSARLVLDAVKAQLAEVGR